MKRTTLVTAGIVVAVVLAAGGGFAYSAANSRTSVGTAAVIREPLSVVVSASGTVDAARSVGVFPSVGGTLASLRVKDGQVVKKGDTLGRLRFPPDRGGISYKE